MRRLEGGTSYERSPCLGHRAGPGRRYRTDVRSSVRCVLPVAAEVACLVLLECAAGWRRPLPFPPACLPSYEYPAPVRPRKSALPTQSSPPRQRCCGIPCPPLLLRCPHGSLHTYLSESFPRSGPPPPDRLPLPSPRWSLCRRRHRHAWLRRRSRRFPCPPHSPLYKPEPCVRPSVS